MNAHELRIGNWLRMPLMDKYVCVDIIKRTGIEASGHIATLCLFEGVELTPEMLDEVFFFYRALDRSHWFIGHHGFCVFFGDDGELCLKPDYARHTVIAYCRYVHQLQNALFVITGQELKIEM